MANAYLINTETMEYPIYEGDYIAMYPDVSFTNPLIPFPPCAWVEYTDQPSYDWVTQGVQEVTPVEVAGVWYQSWEVYELTPEQVAENHVAIQQNNKAAATKLLSNTDWTATVDINNPAYSNPYLGNQDAFLAYRSQVRQIAVNPPITPAVFPVAPQEVWITV